MVQLPAAALSPNDIARQLREALGGSRPKTDPAVVAKALQSLGQLGKGVDPGLFDVGGLKDADAARQRLGVLENGALKAVQAAAEQARKVAKLAEGSASDLKAAKGAPRALVGAVDSLIDDANGYAKQIVVASEQARAQLRKLIAALEEKEKKAAKDSEKDQDDDGEAAAREKSLEAIGGRVATAMKLARTAGSAKPMKYLIGVLKKDVFVYVGKSASSSLRTAMKGWMNAGQQSVKFHTGDVLFEEKAHTFVGIDIPTGGFAVRIQKALITLTKMRYKIRVRRTTGETDEAAGDEGGGDADDVLEAAKDQGGRQGGLAGLVAERHKRIKEQLGAVLVAGGELADRAGKALGRFEREIAAKKFEQAMKVLDDIQTGVLDAAKKQREARQRAEQDYTRRFQQLLPQAQKLVKQGGKAAEEVGKRLAAAGAAGRQAARDLAKDAFDVAHRELDALQNAVDWALSDKSPGERVDDVERGAERLKQQAERELKQRLANLRANVEKVVRTAGRGAEAVGKRVAEAEKLIEEAAKTGVKDAVAKAHRAIDVVQMAVDDALDETRKEAVDAGKRVQALLKTLQAHRDAAAKALEKIVDKGARGRFEAVLKALKAEIDKAARIADDGRRVAAHEALVEKARQAEEAVAKAAAEAEKSHRAAEKAKGEQSAEMKALIARFQALMTVIRTLESDKAPGAAALKKAAIDAGNLATSPQGIARAVRALDQVEAGIEDAKRKLAEAQTVPEAPPKPELSPEAKKFVDRFKTVMAQVQALDKEKNPEAAALKKAAVEAGNMGTTPAGIRRGHTALDGIVKAVAKARETAQAAAAEAKKARAEAEARAAERFDVKAGGRTLKGATRDEALAALRTEANRLNAELEGGWALHVDQMNLPNEVPFQAWLTSGVNAIKGLFPGQHAAKMPDLNMWDRARELLIDVRKAEKKGDVKAIEALLPAIDKEVKTARGRIGRYKEGMEDAAQTGVDAGRMVEKAGTMAAGELGKKAGGKGGKVAAEAAYAAGLEGVGQFTEWFIGSRREFNAAAIAERGAEQAAGAIIGELVSGALAEPFKKIFGSYIGRAVDDAALKAMGLTRDAFMSASQKYIAEFLAKMSGTAVKTVVVKQVKNVKGKGELMSMDEMMNTIAAELAKGASLKLFMDGIKSFATA